MDKNVSVQEACDDVTRESLIAISYRLPEKDIKLNTSPGTVSNGNRSDDVNGDGAEKYRSNLISISYSESPDVKAGSVPPGGI